MTWSHIPVRRLFNVVNGGTPSADPSNWDGGVLWATPVDLAKVDGSVLVETERTLSDVGLKSGSRAVPAEALILSTRAPIGYVAETRTTMAFNQGCRGLVPCVPMALRFFRYQFSGLASQLAASGQGSTFLELSGDALAAVRLAVPPVANQHEIATYLDRETARLDAVVSAKRRMVALLEERWQGFLESRIRDLAGRFGEIRLKYVCREVVVGIVITPSAWYAETGVPAIRGINVAPGSISADDLVYLTPEGHARHPKSRLQLGDVVVVRTGQAGAAAVVPEAFAGANCIDLVIIRLGEKYSPNFLEFVLNSDWMQKHIEEHSVGTIQSHFNVGAAAAVPIPRAPLEEQESALAALQAERRRLSGLIDVVSRQVRLLQERRRALITAAVSGELRIPEAA